MNNSDTTSETSLYTVNWEKKKRRSVRAVSPVLFGDLLRRWLSNSFKDLLWKKRKADTYVIWVKAVLAVTRVSH